MYFERHFSRTLSFVLFVTLSCKNLQYEKSEIAYDKMTIFPNKNSFYTDI